MTKREFQTLGRRLEPLLPDFRAHGALLLLAPVQQTLRAVVFDGSSFDRNVFYAQVMLQPLFVPAEHVALNIGWRLGGGSHSWDIRAEDLETQLVSALTTDAVPFLRSVETTTDLIRAIESLHKSADVYVRRALAYARARAGQAEGVAALLRLSEELAHAPNDWQRALSRETREFAHLARSNPRAAEQKFLSREQETARVLGVEKFLGPSRIPLKMPL